MRNAVKRYISLVVAFTLVLAIPFAFTQEANADSKKTIYLLTQEKETYTTTTYNKSGQVRVKYSTKHHKKTITYDKNGLRKSCNYKSGHGSLQYKYFRNRKGFLTKVKKYNKGSNRCNEEEIIYKVNTSGQVVSSKRYTDPNDHKQLWAADEYKYYKNGTIKKDVQTLLGDKSIYYYDKYGYKTKVIESDGRVSKVENTFDKHHNPLRIVETNGTVYAFKYVYSKKGRVLRREMKEVTISGNVYYTVSKRTYDKHGNMIKEVVETQQFKNESAEFPYATRKTIFTRKYKEFKVDKKTLRLITNELNLFEPMFEGEW